MSDYPRPENPTPARSYPLDRIIAITFAILVLWSKILWLVDILHRQGSAIIVGNWRWIALSEFATLALYAWVLSNFARSRFWAFVTTLGLSAMSIFASIELRWLGHAAFGAFLFAYATARLFNMLGPRPLRRLDLIPR